MAGIEDALPSPGAGDRLQKPESAAADTRGLVSRASRGDRTAFDALYAKIAPALYAWSSLRIHPSLRGRLEPEDVVQETWWRALESFGTFDTGRGAFRTWLFQIAKNTMLNAFRRLRVRGEIAGGGGRRLGELPDHLAAEATSVSRQAARSEEARILLDAIHELSQDDRALVACCAIEGLSAPEAGDVLGISPEAAKKRWTRLKARLRAELAPLLPPPAG